MKLSTITSLVALTAVVFSALPTLAEAPLIEVGSKAPRLELTGDDGTRHSLALSQGPKILIFYRGLW